MVIIVLLVSALFVSLVFAGDPPADRIISTSGTGTVSGTPDIAVLEVGISSSSWEPRAATADIATRSDLVMAAVRNITQVKLETSDYELIKREYDNKGCSTCGPAYSYEATTWLKISTTNLDKAGDLIDAVTKTGANKIKGIRYEFSPEHLESMTQDAIRAAINDAKNQADVALSGFGKSRGDVISVTVSGGNLYYSPMRSYDVKSTEYDVATQIALSDQDITAYVSCQFLI